MKQSFKVFIVIVSISFALFLSLGVIAQDKHQCVGKTKAGVQCSRKTEGVYCKQHDPASPRCGATKKDGQPCMRVVKVAGQHCFQHKAK